ncbi:MAG: hypothetical protein QOH90_410 [Actinomycetota bacterium]|jgi:hypothetical protein|nr:hypothetical protein [Actinomycetota bacterium]
MRTKSRITALGGRLGSALVIVALVAAGCSSKDEGTTPGAAASGSPTNGASAPASPFPSGTGGLVPSPFSSTSYSPYGFEVCEPEHIDTPDWLPEDLPLPEGIYATDTEDPLSGYQRVFMIIPETTTIPEFTRMIVKEWPKAGYQIGRGDSEQGEVEAEFSKPPATGAFKVQATSCDNPGYSVMYLIYAPTGPALPSPSPSKK